MDTNSAVAALKEMLSNPNFLALYVLSIIAFAALLSIIVIAIWRAIDKKKRKKNGEIWQERKQQRDTEDYEWVLKTLPYKKQAIVTDGEKPMLLLLDQIAQDNNMFVFTKVRLGDIVQLDRGNYDYDASDRNKRAWRELSNKHVDFVLVRKSSMKIACVIEYDDFSHNNESAMRNDVFKNNVMNKVGLPLIRIRYGNWDKQSVEKALKDRDVWLN